jgi:hypothetical protein
MRTLSFVTAAIVAGGLIIGAQMAYGQSGPGDLSMQQLRSTTARAGSTCACVTGVDGSLTFDVTGAAAGPYPGTFVASGRVVLTGGAVTAVTETFKIISGTDTVAGTVTGVESGGSGFCVRDFGMASLVYRYEAMVRSSGGASREVAGRGNLTVSGGPVDATQAFQDFGA